MEEIVIILKIILGMTKSSSLSQESCRIIYTNIGVMAVSSSCNHFIYHSPLLFNIIDSTDKQTSTNGYISDSTGDFDRFTMFSEIMSF